MKIGSGLSVRISSYEERGKFGECKRRIRESQKSYDLVEIKTTEMDSKRRKLKRNPSDSDSIELPIPIATQFFYLHSNVRLFTLPTQLPITSLVGTSSKSAPRITLTS